MNRLSQKQTNNQRRTYRVRSRLHGTAERPRFSINISNLHITAQLIDDNKKITLLYATTVGSKLTGTMSEKAAQVGAELAKKAAKTKIKKVTFDRGARAYHGRVKALADAAREGGLEF